MATPILAWSLSKSEGNEVALHSHNYYEVVFYEKGLGSGIIGDKEYRFSPGTFIVIPPNEQHDERHEADGRLHCIGFLADGELSVGVFFDYGGKIKELVYEMLFEVGEQKKGYKRMLELKMEELIISVKRLVEKNETKVKDFEFAAEYIKSNFHEKLLLSDIAEQMHLSYDYFRHRFQLLYGMSPQRYLLTARLSKARELLCETKLSCTEIAGRCGFSGSSQFSMLFKREYGATPRSLRNGK